MLELFWAMMKEEWRLHSKLVGSMMFAIFPVFTLLFGFGGTLVLPYISQVVPHEHIILSVHLLYTLFGVSVGAFGLMSREFMNRRFGQASLLAYSSRSLPVGEKTIFVNFLVKDVVYYLLMWILPFVVGSTFGMAVLGMPSVLGLVLLVSLTLSFKFGLSISFLLSTAYVNSTYVFTALLSFFASLVIFSLKYFGWNIFLLYGPYQLFSGLKIPLATIIFITIATAVSIMFIRTDYDAHKKAFASEYAKMRFYPKRYSEFMAKDYLDIKRSQGGFAKILFSFLLPVGLIYAVIYPFTQYFPEADLLVLFSVFLGILSTSIYSWLTEFEVFNTYAFLPVRVSDVIKSKIILFFTINLISPVILVAFAVYNSLGHLMIGLITLISVIVYTLSITVHLTGLYPNLYLYSAKVFGKYLLYNIVVILGLVLISILDVLLLYLSLLLIPLAAWILKRALARWDRQEQVSI